MRAPIVDIDLQAFHTDPYPDLEVMRKKYPICYEPQLDATLLTRHSDIVRCEKIIEVFSSQQPGGLMTVLMGENMMRKDREAHTRERKQALPSLSPRTVKQVWKQRFEESVDEVLLNLQSCQSCDLVQDFAMPVAAQALRHITGLTSMTSEQMDVVSQGMIDGISNYTGIVSVQERCNQATALVDQHIEDMQRTGAPEHSLLQVLSDAGQPTASVSANIKLAISGGQNEPRDAIAGCVWALLTHASQLHSVMNGRFTWRQAFEEYCRWISPIGMSPRRIAQEYSCGGVDLVRESRAFLMFASGNRDERVFENPDQFDLGRDTSDSISFGAGPHFCAGAAASRMLISEVALPKLFKAFPEIALDGDVAFSGWAFRGPESVPVLLS